LRCRNLVWIVAAAGITACGREKAGSGSGLRVVVDTANGMSQARIVVRGIDDANLSALRAAGWTAEPTTALLQVRVAGNTTAQVAGRHAVTDDGLEFRPLFPFERGRSYVVRVEPRELPVTGTDSAVTATIAFPAPPRTPSTVVQRVLPTSGAVPENLLRLYIEFSEPMSRRSGVGFVHLIDDSGHEVEDAFLPLDADFWNPDRTRYTLFLDPGRVKRGIRPNEQMGRALRAGRSYALVIDSAWRDANEQPLVKAHRIEFSAEPAVLSPIVLGEWKVGAPRAGTTMPLTVSFPRPLDYGLLNRALGVERDGKPVSGTVSIVPSETQWRFTPAEAWRPGGYHLVVLAVLEDVAGNRIGRAFEVDMFERVDSTSVPERHRIPFSVR
jgi:hypothetical protein